MIAWMLYAAAASAALGLAALAAERVLRLYALPTRWAWAAALALSLAAPLALAGGASSDSRLDLDSAVGASVALDVAPSEDVRIGAATVVDAPAEPAWTRMIDRMDEIAPMLWLVSSLALMAALLWASLSLGRRRRTWERAEVGGAPVLLSEGTGPAVVGFVRPDVVLPRWTLLWAEPLQRLIVRHEREHIRAGDPRLLLFALAAVALVPWNPAAWWQLRRLRLAMEVDCDARILARERDVAAYGTLLLEVGRRGAGTRIPVAAFSEPRSFLERRIRIMTSRPPRDRGAQALALALLCAGALVAFSALPAPALPRPLMELTIDTAPGAQPARAERATARAVSVERGVSVDTVIITTAQARAFAEARAGTPVTVETVTTTAATTAATARAGAAATADTITTETLAKRALQARIAAEYPPLLRAAGIAGEATVRARVAADGRMADATVLSATRPEFAAAALRVVEATRVPAERVSATRVWLTLPVRFEPRAATAVAARAAAVDTIRLVPNTRVDQLPELQNAAEVARVSEAEYPPMLREAGVEGRARVRVVVGTDGRPAQLEVLSATRDEFREPARRVASRMRFSPAKKDGRPVAVEVDFGVSFRPRAAAAEREAAVRAEATAVATAGARREDLEAIRREHEAMRRRQTETEQRLREALGRHQREVLRRGTAEDEYVFFVVDGSGAVKASGTGKIPAGEVGTGWSSNSLVEQIQARFPGMRVAKTFHWSRMAVAGEGGPRANVAWVTVE